tara:strand:- start:590 stop:862 length:273 start_codon:yes stop_codon:yes gene_type:complete
MKRMNPYDMWGMLSKYPRKPRRMRMMNNEEREANEVMKLIWQALYVAQDEDKVRRGDKGIGYFHIWRGGKAFKVTVQLDNFEDNNRSEEE